MAIEYLTLAITAVGWLVTAYFQRQLYVLQSRTEKQLADQQERYNRQREKREYVIPERLAFLKQLQQWFTEGFAIYQDAGSKPVSPTASPERLELARRTIDWGDRLVLLLPWALFNDPYPPGSTIWTPTSGIPTDRLVDLMFALRHVAISLINPVPDRPQPPITQGELIELLRMNSFLAVERVRSRILGDLEAHA